MNRDSSETHCTCACHKRKSGHIATPPSAPRARVATIKEFRTRLEHLAKRSMIWKKHDDPAYPKAMACYQQGYRQALRDAGVDVFHVRARIGGTQDEPRRFKAGTEGKSP